METILPLEVDLEHSSSWLDFLRLRLGVIDMSWIQQSWNYLGVMLVAASMVLGSVGRSEASIVISLEPVQSFVESGSPLNVNVFLTPTVNSQLAGYTVGILTNGGVFTGGTIDLKLGSENEQWFIDEPPFNNEIFATYAAPAGVSRSLTAGDRVLFGTVIVDTTGLADGVYELSFSTIGGIDLDNNLIAFNPANPNGITNFIVGVPEPTSMALMAVAGAGFFVRRRLRK